MYAVIDDRGRQYRATTGEKLTLDRSIADVGATIELPVLLLASDAGVQVGAPYVAGAKAVCKVIDHPRGEKITIGKYKRRKRNMKRRGFRHAHTVVEIVSIG
ncbi:MAG: 50S ribosomal protein L21 [Planctomycetes bacterium]|nr:50S ribosomal protein L21 [Planctomycetota bacterium]